MGILLIFGNLTNLSNRNMIYTIRKFSLNCCPDMNKSVSKQGKMMNKLLGVDKKKRNFYFDEPTLVPSGTGLKIGNHLKNSKENNKRIAVLNSLFMQHISDLLATGSASVELVDKGLEISRVAVTSTFNQVNVFWATSKAENVEALTATLPQIGYTLRHELTQLQVMGVVPRIVFIRDKKLSTAQQVDYLLSIADYGEDYVPSELESDFKSTPLEENVSTRATQSKDENLNQEQNINEEETTITETMPIMRQDIFNLDHDLIMNKIMKSLQKSKAVHRFQPHLAIDSPGAGPKLTRTNVENMSKQERKEAMEKFVLNRKIIQGKLKSKKYASHLNVPYFTHEEDDDYEVERHDYDIEDYIDEDLEDPNIKSSQV